MSYYLIIILIIQLTNVNVEKITLMLRFAFSTGTFLNALFLFSKSVLTNMLFKNKVFTVKK